MVGPSRCDTKIEHFSILVSKFRCWKSYTRPTLRVCGPARSEIVAHIFVIVLAPPFHSLVLLQLCFQRRRISLKDSIALCHAENHIAWESERCMSQPRKSKSPATSLSSEYSLLTRSCGEKHCSFSTRTIRRNWQSTYIRELTGIFTS